MLLRTASEFDDEVDGGSPTRETPAAGGAAAPAAPGSIVGVGAWVDGLWLAGARPGGPGNGVGRRPLGAWRRPNGGAPPTR